MKPFKAESSPSSLNAPGTANLRHPRLAIAPRNALKIPKPAMPKIVKTRATPVTSLKSLLRAKR